MKKKIPKHLKTWLVLFLALTAGLAALFFLLSPRATEAAWWDETWLYRKAVQISNANSEDLTDFQVAITLDTASLITAGKMQSDCDDLRITDQNGQVLPHWIEENNPGCNNAATKVWVKIPTVHKGTNATTVYAYYGNTQAENAENGDNVFEFFDDFNNISFLNTSKWTANAVNTITYSFNANKLRITDATKSGANYWIYNNTDTGSQHQAKYGITDNLIVEWRSTLNDVNAPEMGQVGFALVDNSSLVRAYLNHSDPAGGSAAPKREWLYETTDTIEGASANETKNFKITRSGTSVEFFIGDVSKTTGTLTSTPTKISLAVGAYGQYAFLNYVDIDYVFTRKYAASEPTSGAPAAEEISPGPVAYWKFDEGTGATAHDSSGQENDGAISGATWQTEEMCVSGKCLQFDGSDDYVSVNNAVSGIKTVSFWVKPNTTTEYFIDLNGSAYISVSSGTISATGFTNPTIYVNGQASTTLLANSWQYITVTTNTALAGSAVNLGKISTNYLQGFLDEVKIYPYARSAKEIKADYAAGLAGIGSTKGSAAIMGSSGLQSALSDGLVGYWKMDEASWTNDCSTATVLDSSGNNNHGKSCPNAAGTQPTGGRFGNGGSFDGSNDYVKVNNFDLHSSQYNNSTVAVWFKENASGRAMIWSVDNGGYDKTLEVDRADSNQICAFTGADSGCITYNTNAQWTHAVIVYHDNNTLDLYVNGELKTAAASTNFGTSQGYLSFGNNGETGEQFNGFIDEVRIYNRALSPAEVKALYEWAPGPVAHFKLDEGAGSAAADSSGYGRSGTVVSGLWTPGKFGGGLKLDGSGDYLEVGDF